MNKSHVTIGLTNPKSPTNVGAVMRAAGCYQVDEVKYTGQRYEKAAKFHTDTKSAARTIPLTGVESFLDNLDPETKIVCVELAEGATPLPRFKHPKTLSISLALKMVLFLKTLLIERITLCTFQQLAA